MKPFGTLDFETDPFQRRDPKARGRDPKAFAASIYDGKRVGHSWSEECPRYVIKECCKHQYKGWIWYAHNGGKFDFHFVLQTLVELFGYDMLDVMAIGSRIVKISVYIPVVIKGREDRELLVEFRDSFCVITKPLKAIAHANKKEIEIWKLESHINGLTLPQRETYRTDVLSKYGEGQWEKYVSPREFYRVEITAYLKQDVKGLYAALDSFFHKFGQEITLASTCFKILKKDFGMPAVRTSEAFDNKFRQHYFAGRVQFFDLGKFGDMDGKKRYNICDINSAFPWAMRFKHFFSPEYITTTRPPKNNAEQCFYDITCDSEGVLPRRNPHTHGVEFPTCRNTRFYATGWEYLAGLELGKIRNVTINAVHLPLEIRDFSNYIDHFYALKKQADEAGDKAERDVQKLFLNGAYGKFALNCREFRNVKLSLIGQIPEPIIIKAKNGKEIKREWVKSYDDIERGLSFWQMPSHTAEGGKPLSFNNVATAASITGCVRAFLARSIANCEGVLYCDTDSIIARDTSRLSLGSELGEWKLEKECDGLFIGGKKLYAAHDFRGSEAGKSEWKTASKGVRLKAEEICRVAMKETVSYSFEAPNYSIFSGITYTTRTIRRDDMRKKKAA